MAALAILLAVGQYHAYTVLGMATPMAPDSGKRALILSPFEDRWPTARLDELVNGLKLAGYSVNFMKDGEITVEFMKSGLTGYGVIIIKTEGMNSRGPYNMLTGEKVVQGKYEEDMRADRVRITDGLVETGYYGVTSKFIQYYYPEGTLAGALIYLYASESTSVWLSFKAAGANSLIGYGNTISLQWGWGDYLTYHLFSALTSGATVKEAVQFVKESTLHDRRDPGQPNVPQGFESLNYEGDADYKIAA